MDKKHRLELALMRAFDSASATKPEELHELGGEACAALRAMQRAIAAFVLALDKKRNPKIYASLTTHRKQISDHRIA